MSEWISQPPLVSPSPRLPLSFAWLSLDAGDNDPVRFLGHVIAALRTTVSGVGETANELLCSPQPPPVESILTVLLNELSAPPDDAVLVLGDYHAIDNAAVHDAVVFLVDHLPPQIHLVIATRADPPLPLARWRSRGHLAELRTDDLRFTPDESAAFLNQVMGLNLSAQEVATLEARTEGWIVGLQMAALVSLPPPIRRSAARQANPISRGATRRNATHPGGRMVRGKWALSGGHPPRAGCPRLRPGSTSDRECLRKCMAKW